MGRNYEISITWENWNIFEKCKHGTKAVVFFERRRAGNLLVPVRIFFMPYASIAIQKVLYVIILPTI